MREQVLCLWVGDVEVHTSQDVHVFSVPEMYRQTAL